MVNKMPCTNFVEKLKFFFQDLKNAKKKLASSEIKGVNNQDERAIYEDLASRWFSEFSKPLNSYGVDKEILIKYNDSFKAILKLSSGLNRRSSYIKYFDLILKNFNEEIIIFMQIDALEPAEVNSLELGPEVTDLLSKISDKDENEYLSEALGCWKNSYLKGATVLLWCCAIDRIHKVIEQIGFNVFNQTSVFMKSQSTGRFKRFSKEYAVQSLSELRTVFDNDILWVIEGMQLIDANERTRLASCFEMRCHSGHPGAAPITKYNVLSCFSDIVEIVLANPKFAINIQEKQN